ncbi:MAG: RNA polymerase sigma factor [Microthrixaceae bacterium]
MWTAPVTHIAFDWVVSQHGPAVLRACRSLVGVVAADDLWSETFMSAMRSYDGSAPPDNTLAWLLTIARRRSVDHWRAAGRRPTTTFDLPDFADGAVEHRLADTDDHLINLLRLLPPKQRWAVAYRYLADLDYDDIAELIGSSPAAARRSAADGVAKLRAALDDEGDAT